MISCEVKCRFSQLLLLRSYAPQPEGIISSKSSQHYFSDASVMYNATTRNNGHTEADLLCSSSKNHDPEDKQHTEPDLPDDSGVGLDLVQQRGQETPFSHGLRSDEEKQI